MNKELRKVIKNAIITATKLDGYSQVIIMENDGSYGYTRKYEGCCPEWLGKNHWRSSYVLGKWNFKSKICWQVNNSFNGRMEENIWTM